MTGAVRTWRGRLVAIASVAIAALVGVPLATPAVAADFGPTSVTLTILDVSPSTPAPSETPEPLVITFRLRNNTGADLTNVQITGVRATPIDGQNGPGADQRLLDAAMAHPAPPDTALQSPIDSPPATVESLPSGSTADTIFTTTTDLRYPRDAGICLCANAIYPLYFTASIESDGRTITVGTAQTYVPAFDITAPAKLSVGWVWPLLDVPHRLTSSTVFRDDDLAAEVAPGGRLDRALQVLETVAPTVPMTVVTDPDLLDELEVMAEGNYSVQHTGAAATVGVGTGLAAAWLARLRAVLTDNPTTELDLTAYGDPDVDGLQRNGLSWTAGTPTDAQARVTTALGGLTPLSDIAWPLNETLSKDTLDTLVRQGTQTVIVNSPTLPGVLAANPSQNALASLTTTYGPATAGITVPSIEAWAARVFVPNGAGASYLPEFVSQVALHAVTSVDESHFVLITPPRLLDVDPDVASRAIEDTATGTWATPLPLRTAIGTEAAKATTVIAKQASRALPDAAVDALRYVNYSLPGLSTLFYQDADRQSEIGSLPTAAQRAASSSLVPDAQAAERYAADLGAVVSTIRKGVHLIKPATGSYTLTSTNASLPITVANDLGNSVKIDITASAVGGVPGFAVRPIESKVINPHSTVQLRLPTHFDRAGRIEVEVRLSTPSNLPLGTPIQLSVRSTALGTIGIVITVVAGVVLFGALLVRALHRLRHRTQDPAQVTT